LLLELELLLSDSVGLRWETGSRCVVHRHGRWCRSLREAGRREWAQSEVGTIARTGSVAVVGSHSDGSGSHCEGGAGLIG